MGLSGGSRASNVGSKWREVQGFAPIPGNAYPVGALLQLAPLDLHTWSDMRTVRPSPAAAVVKAVVGLVADEWITGPGVTVPGSAPQGGFGGGSSIAPGSTANASAGTDRLPVVVRGICMRGLIDNTNGAAAITHGLALSSASNVIGKMMQGPAAPVEGAFVASALLNSVAPFNTLGTGAVAAATQTITLSGTAPAAGDVYIIPFQIPFSPNQQGIAQFKNLVVGPLTAAQAGNVTNGALAVSAAIAADPVISQFYTAVPAVGVVTVTIVAGNQFRIGGQGYSQGGNIWGSQWELTTSGTMGNGMALGAPVVSVGAVTITNGGGSAAGQTGYPAGSTLFSGGTGYIGTCPVFVGGIYG